MEWLDGEVIDQSIEMNIIAWRSPDWIRRSLLYALLWLYSPLSALMQKRGSFKSYKLQRTVEDLKFATKARSRNFELESVPLELLFFVGLYRRDAAARDRCDHSRRFPLPGSEIEVPSEAAALRPLLWHLQHTQLARGCLTIHKRE